MVHSSRCVVWLFVCLLSVVWLVPLIPNKAVQIIVLFNHWKVELFWCTLQIGFLKQNNQQQQQSKQAGKQSNGPGKERTTGTSKSTTTFSTKSTEIRHKKPAFFLAWIFHVKIHVWGFLIIIKNVNQDKYMFYIFATNFSKI